MLLASLRSPRRRCLMTVITPLAPANALTVVTINTNTAILVILYLYAWLEELEQNAPSHLYTGLTRAFKITRQHRKHEKNVAPHPLPVKAVIKTITGRTGPLPATAYSPHLELDTTRQCTPA